MTVQNLFEAEGIDQSFIAERMCDGRSYWDSVATFIDENWENLISRLSAKQKVWLDRILEDCVEQRIEGRR